MKTYNIDRVPVKMKIGYGFGDLGANFIFQNISIFLLIYLTDVVGIEAAVSGFIILIAKFWDAFFDPFVGYFCDHTHTRWGSKRPFLLWFSVPLWIAFALLFFGPDIGEAWKPWYCGIMFVLVCSFYALVNIPYGSLTASMSRDMHERSSITVYRMLFAIVGSIIVTVLVPPYVAAFGASHADQVIGHRWMGFFSGMAAAAFTLITFFSVRERVDEDKKQKGGHSLKEVWQVIKTNPPFLIISLATLVQFVAMFLMANAINYYFKYCFIGQTYELFGSTYQVESFRSIGFFFIFATAFICLPLWSKVARAVSKKFVFNAGMLVLALAMSMCYFVQNFNISIFIGIFLLSGVGWSVLYLSPWSIMPDTVEYSQWKTGLRREGTLYGFFYFAQKVAAAVAGWMAGTWLDWYGYAPNLAQTEQSLLGIRILLTWLPVGIIIIGVIVMWFYPINETTHRKMLADIETNNQAGTTDKYDV